MIQLIKLGVIYRFRLLDVTRSLNLLSPRCVSANTVSSYLTQNDLESLFVTPV